MAHTEPDAKWVWQARVKCLFSAIVTFGVISHFSQYMEAKDEVRQTTTVESKDKVRQTTSVESKDKVRQIAKANSKDEARQSSNYSKQACQKIQVAGLVCKKCLKDDPSQINLITYKCFQADLHLNEPRVTVEWVVSNNRLERLRSNGSGTPRASIRPMPQAFFRGEFVLCDRGRRCKRRRCTFPHSVEERDAWNAEKFGSKCTSATPTQFYGNWFMFYLYRTLRDNVPN